MQQLQELHNDARGAAELEEGKRGTDDYKHKHYQLEANTAGICALLQEKATERGLQQKQWQYQHDLGEDYGLIYWAFSGIAREVTERRIFLDDIEPEGLRYTLLSALEGDISFRDLLAVMTGGLERMRFGVEDSNKEGIKEAHAIASDFIRQCLS